MEEREWKRIIEGRREWKLTKEGEERIQERF